MSELTPQPALVPDHDSEAVFTEQVVVDRGNSFVDNRSAPILASDDTVHPLSDPWTAKTEVSKRSSRNGRRRPAVPRSASDAELLIVHYSVPPTYPIESLIVEEIDRKLLPYFSDIAVMEALRKALLSKWASKIAGRTIADLNLPSRITQEITSAGTFFSGGGEGSSDSRLK